MNQTRCLSQKICSCKLQTTGMAIEQGANIRDVQLHLRHTNINTTEIYLKAFRSSTSKEFIEKFPEL